MIGGIELDLRITIGTIIEICVILGGGISALAVIKTRVVVLSNDLMEIKHDTSKAFTEIKADATLRFNAVNVDIKRVNDILVSLADQNRRIIHLEDDVREMKHGRGYVEGPRGIGGIEN